MLISEPAPFLLHRNGAGYFEVSGVSKKPFYIYLSALLIFHTLCFKQMVSTDLILSIFRISLWVCPVDFQSRYS
jgi:hypothetical protein